MSELSTADLAGGNTPRDRMDKDTSTSTSTHDPQFYARDNTFDTHDDTMASTETRPGDAGFETRDEKTSSSMPTTPHRTSQLANPAATDGTATDHGAASLFSTGEAGAFRLRWQEVQVGFVDDPGTAVEQADGLVAEMMQRLATVFADERAKLEEQWSRGDDISTEDLRVALRRYRSFFDRLLSV